jgi:hypothetical protein
VPGFLLLFEPDYVVGACLGIFPANKAGMADIY